MARLLFEKTGNSVWISHLDLMRLFQRAFKRAALPLKHTQGFNPRPSVSIALPLSVGVESSCELLDFDLDGCSCSCDEIAAKLKPVLVDGVRVLDCYDSGKKIRDLAYLACNVELEYDDGLSDDAVKALRDIFYKESLFVIKKSKNGPVEQDIIPMIKSVTVEKKDANTVLIHAVICCQNPSLNPVQLVQAIQKYLPELKPDFAKCRRTELYDATMTVFR